MSRIGLDTRPMEKGFKAHFGRGTGRYTTELIEELERKLEQVQSDIEFFRIENAILRPSIWGDMLLKCLPFGTRTFESQVYFPRQIKRLGLDLVHFFSHGDAPSLTTVPQVLSVLDLIPLRFPQLYQGNKSGYRFRFARWLERQAIAQAAGILAISESTKRDLVELLGVAEDTIVVTPLAAGREFSPRVLAEASWREKIIEIRRKYNFPCDRALLLYVGGIDPRKNVLFLLKVFSELLTNASFKHKPLLLMAGRYQNDDQYPLLCSEIRNLGIEEDVNLIGFVPEAELPDLYRLADLVLFPSLYEGFGLPVLEAMSCGVPVMAPDNSSIPEVVGDDLPLFRDNDLDAWVRGVVDILASEERQLELSRRGVGRAQCFSWERCADETLNAYCHFLANNSKSPH